MTTQCATPLASDYSQLQAVALGKTVYEDQHLRIDGTGITIFHYYFPVAVSKFVAWSELEAVNIFPSERVDFLYVKGWGMSLNPIWWALDLSRKFSSEGTLLVLKTKDDRIRKGSTVMSMVDAIRVIQLHLPGGVKFSSNPAEFS
jgi:hypothetical protein